ncbi:MAG TPA: hypothetical protein VGB02_04275 [Pyrinomonadaceae bacterium]
MQTEKKIYNPKDNRDLGFGSILSQEARTRFTNGNYPELKK